MELSIPPEDFDWLMDRAGVSCPRAREALRLRCVDSLLWSAVASRMELEETAARLLCETYHGAILVALQGTNPGEQPQKVERIQGSDALLLTLFRNSDVGRDHGPAYQRNPYTGETVAVQLRGAVLTAWDLETARRFPRGDLMGQGNA